jgi:hypothetical protein
MRVAQPGVLEPRDPAPPLALARRYASRGGRELREEVAPRPRDRLRHRVDRARQKELLVERDRRVRARDPGGERVGEVLRPLRVAQQEVQLEQHEAVERQRHEPQDRAHERPDPERAVVLAEALLRADHAVRLGERAHRRAHDEARVASPLRACASSCARSATRSCGSSTARSGRPSVSTRRLRRPTTLHDAFGTWVIANVVAGSIPSASAVSVGRRVDRGTTARRRDGVTSGGE